MINKQYLDFIDRENIFSDKEEIAKVETFLSFERNNGEKIAENELFVRHVLELPLKKATGSKKICFCLMNPSKADMQNSDDTVNIVLKFVEKLMIEANSQFKDIGAVVVVNLFPTYETRSTFLGTVIKGLQKTNKLDHLLFINQTEIMKQVKNSEWIILGWGNCPENLSANLHKTETNKILAALYKVQKESSIYIFEDKKNKGLTIKKHPRHPRRLHTDTSKISEIKIKKNNKQGNNKIATYEIKLKNKG
ncbi:DUF1643 domain-containing protein [Paenibacillus polymyxa]|uniref:DUF1643 domain-containing protein n=1 Tax=Paenibacillus polymyxa TaxID=1406 RepID=UPI002AB42291|nr:DUF1643 domain-containing protein [Paenibacillus polymyxa]MDY8021996.1 DUF1643 domain-containing protein [Paenibacillus polymyxa]